MSEELTTEEKRKRLIAIAEGKSIEAGLKPVKAIWIWEEDTQLYEGRGPSGEYSLNEEQFQVYCNKFPNQLNIVIRMRLAEGCAPLVPLSYSDPVKEPDSKPTESHLKAIEETITQETTAEVVDKATPETESETRSGDVVVIGTVKPGKITFPGVDQLDWEDSDMIGYMFPKRR